MQQGWELAGRYRLEAVLGRGGMGEVWRAVDLRLGGRPVAVKILPVTAGAGTAGVARFRREAEIAASLNHPGITTVFDIDEHEQDGHRLLFLVMELLEGRDLAQVLAAGDALPVEQVADLAAQLADALAAAHRRAVVHRDIKPANLFLLPDGKVKICDFGIARLADATKITATGSIAGTPVYMAPEQIQSGDVDQRTDLYSLGCVLYELLTGETWVDRGTGAGAILYQHLEQTPKPPRSLRPEIPEHLDALVMDLLAKQPGDRPADAAAVSARLRPGPREPQPAAPPASPAESTPPSSPAEPPHLPPPSRMPPPPPAVFAEPQPWMAAHAPYPYQPGTQPGAAPARTRPAGGATAHVAAALASLCFLWAFYGIAMNVQFILKYPRDSIAWTWWLHGTVCVVEGVLFGVGIPHLLQRREDGRWLVFYGALLLALQATISVVVFMIITGGSWKHASSAITYLVIGPLMTLPAVGALVLAMLPATRRWCAQEN
ncbi:serine/threonine-protein kinase [Actinomadura macrotermitis]|uniref:non-specific serine/threonine protein kinase n=1 Tax=Actinomadura macrotermitis TaxID=2585200 RepID=A0A7K0C2G1_9ACTN|nr:serine/threonine-protein kinase [Actinomadura macrotermitis]MQY07629.1 Serine/threonine-protein kinase PknD [Actinomadura macrotermitis]